MSNISGNAFGALAYQQTNAWWNGGKRTNSAESRREERTGKSDRSDQVKSGAKAESTSKISDTSKVDQAEGVSTNNNVKTSIWSNKGVSSVPVPSYSKDYGTVIGDVSLSKEASDYYNKLKAKYGNMEFVLVSKDQKAAVQANVSKYGNAKKPVVLIDDEKLERMATDKNFREKYEGIISMAQNQLSSMKNDLSSSGAAVKNFGMSVNEDGSTSYFAVMEKSSKAQAERIEKKREEKVQAKKEAKKAEHKKAEAKKAEEKTEAKKADKKAKADKLEEKRAEKADDDSITDEDAVDGSNSVKHGRTHRSYTEFTSSSLEDLVSAVRSTAYSWSLGSVQTSAELKVGQSIDFKG